MKYFVCFILSLLLFCNNLLSQEYTIKGHITDSKNHESLAFTSVSYNNNQNGVIANIDGSFVITCTSQYIQLQFNLIGYEIQVKTIKLDSIQTTLNIELKKKQIELNEIVVKPGVNPAHRIIQKVIENRDVNNPEKMQSFSYKAYNKFYFTFQNDSTQKPQQNIIPKDSIKKDSTDIRLKKFINNQHLFLSEFVSERHFKKPDKNLENVISSKISGLNDPIFVLLATQMQSFSFYNEYITILDKYYINPISSGSINRYFFLLEDTLFSNMPDTIFVISFRPQKGKNFDGLSGIFYINSNGYAVQNVTAIPTVTDVKFSIKIQQQYQLIENKQWFPVELNTSIILQNTNFKTLSNKYAFLGIGKSYLTDIKLNPDVSDIKFSNVELEISPQANKQTDTFWMQHRAVPLSKKDSLTYHIIDSIGKKYQLDKKMALLEALIFGYIPIGGFHVDYRKILGYNKFEGLKTGLGLATNPKIFSFASIGGFFTYGFGDKNWKYGGFIQLFPKWYSNTKFTVRYANNVTETGGYNFHDEYILNSTEIFRTYFIERMDKAKEIETSFESRILKYVKFNIYVNRTDKTFNNYQYLSTSNPPVIYSQMIFTEIGMQLKFSYGEKFMKTPRGQLLSLGTKFPILWVNIRQGTNLLDGKSEYTKLEAKFAKTFLNKTMGSSSVQIKTGKIIGNIPLSNLYSAQGCFENYSIDSENNFATIRPGEFYSKEFLFLFFKQNFGSLLYKGKKFRPELIFATNYGLGKLPNKEAHQGITFRTMDKGYIESGILLNKIIRMDFTSLGFGCYYRYGNYRLDKIANNFAYKLAFTYSL